MTRAKEMLIFVGSRKVLNYMVSNSHENVRRTGLKYRLIEEVQMLRLWHLFLYA